MQRLAVVLLLGLALGSCGDNLTPPRPEAPKVTPPAATPPPADLVNALRRDSEGLVTEVAPDGTTKMLNLQGRFRNVLVARPNPDGTVTVTTATGIDATGQLTTPRGREFK
jgi:hypothetical protein